MLKILLSVIKPFHASIIRKSSSQWLAISAISITVYNAPRMISVVEVCCPLAFYSIHFLIYISLFSHQRKQFCEFPNYFNFMAYALDVNFVVKL